MAPLPDRLPSDGSLVWTFVVAKRRAVLRGVVMMATAGVAIVSTLVFLESLSAPWARSLGWWPTPAGDWIGELDARNGFGRPASSDPEGRWRQRRLRRD